MTEYGIYELTERMIWYYSGLIIKSSEQITSVLKSSLRADLHNNTLSSVYGHVTDTLYEYQYDEPSSNMNKASIWRRKFASHHFLMPKM